MNTDRTHPGFPAAMIRVRRWFHFSARISLLLILPAAGCRGLQQATPPVAPAPRHEMIDAMKGLEKTLGFPRTDNFSRHSNKIKAYYRCYYTGKFELPSSYEELKLEYGNEAGCAIDQEKYDVFFYPVEAVANGNSPVTSSLAQTSLERFLVVVPHEDFHEDKKVQKLPSTMGEAAATLIGFLTAAEFAEKKFGATSEVYRNLAREAELFLRKAEIVNRYHARLSSFYSSVHSGEITPQNALAQKEQLFAQMQGECKGLRPLPSSFNECPGAINNAGLAFDRTYTQYYPLLHELFVAQDRDVKTTIEAIKGLLAAGSMSEADAAAALRDMIEQWKQASSTPP